jgi:aspartyl aminopeptidase
MCEVFANDFIDFLNESCTAFHAVEASKRRLLQAGFIELSEKDQWKLVRGGKYFFIRSGTTIIAFYVGEHYPESNGIFTIGKCVYY